MSDLKEVSAKSPKLKRETVIMVNYGKDVDESVDMFGAEAVNSNALANWTVTLQAGIRRAHTAGKTDDEIQELLENAKMGVAVSGGRIDPIQASLAKFKTMNENERAEFLESLKAAAAE